MFSTHSKVSNPLFTHERLYSGWCYIGNNCMGDPYPHSCEVYAKTLLLTNIQSTFPTYLSSWASQTQPFTIYKMNTLK